MVCQKQRILSNWVTTGSWPSNSSFHVLIHSVGKSIPHPLSTKNTRDTHTQAEARASLWKLSSNIAFILQLLKWICYLCELFRLKIVSFTRSSMWTCQTLLQLNHCNNELCQGEWKDMKGPSYKSMNWGWSVVFVWPWDGNLVLVSTYLQLAWGCTREKKARPPKVKAETWLTPLLHLDLEWRMLHLLKCDFAIFFLLNNFSCSSEREKVEGKRKDALFIWQSASTQTIFSKFCSQLHCLWFFQAYHVSQGLRIWRFQYFVLKTPKDIRQWPSARKELNEGHKVMKDVTFFWLLDSFGGFESKTGPGFFFFSHPWLQVQYQGIDTI